MISGFSPSAPGVGRRPQGHRGGHRQGIRRGGCGARGRGAGDAAGDAGDAVVGLRCSKPLVVDDYNHLSLSNWIMDSGDYNLILVYG